MLIYENIRLIILIDTDMILEISNIKNLFKGYEIQICNIEN